MNKLVMYAILPFCAIAANSNIAVSAEPGKWYVETSLGFKDYAIHNYKVSSNIDYSQRRWLNFNYGTDITLGIGYYVRKDIRISAGYKRSNQQSLNFFNGNFNGTIGSHNFKHTIDAYIVSVYKDFPVTNSNWTPYVGAGLGIANVSNTSSTSGLTGSTSGSPYGHFMAGLSYSLKKLDLFGEASYGGIGTTNMTLNGGTIVQLEKLNNLTGSFGMRYRF